MDFNLSVWPSNEEQQDRSIICEVSDDDEQ